MHSSKINITKLKYYCCNDNDKRKEGNEMGLLTFKGGIHPDDGKRFSKDQPIRPVVPQGELVYPLSQHIGAPAKPVVKKAIVC